MKIQWHKIWSKRLWLGAFALLVGLSSVVFMLNQASAVAQGDGLLVYGASGNSTPQLRTYTGSTNSFSSAGNTVAGAQALASVIRTSPTKTEVIAGYLNSTGVLRIMCYDGVSWSNEWNVTVGGTGATRAFDIAYETNTGDVMVLYGNNGASLGYKTKAGSTGCGTANWASASTFTPARTTGTIQWVKMAWDKRGSSNLITAIWTDSNADLSSQVWSGSAWGNEHTSALETSLEVVTAAQDVEDFDVEYESSSGDVMVVWANSAGANGTNGVRYATCTGGTSSCTWSGALTPATFSDDATNLDLSANPNTDQMIFASIGNAGADLQAGYWSGTAWTNTANLDTSASTPAAKTKLVATGWLVNGSTTRAVVAYNDSAATVVSYRLWDGSAFTPAAASSPLTFTPTPALANPQKVYDIQTDPFNKDRLMFTLSDGNADLFAKQLTMSATPAFTWANADGGAALEGTLGQSTVGDFSYAYWRYIPAPTYDQSAYRWYSNADSVTPGSALANENTAHTLTSIVSPIRLRTQLSLSTDPMLASSQAFKLQYATSTSGPWTDVGATGADGWCNDTTGITCTTSWGARRKITLNNSASGTNLTDFPVLVKVNSSRIDYSKTQSAGQDIRFVDPSDPNTVLPYEIESWDEAGDSYVWVKVPQIDAGSTTDYIWMYYDNASASDGQAATSVWDGNYKAIYHSEETSGTTMSDSTSNANNATKFGTTSPSPTTGKISGGQSYDLTAGATAPASSSLNNLTSAITTSAWVYASSAIGSYETIFCKENSGSGVSNPCLQAESSAKLDFSFSSGGYVELLSNTSLGSSTWYYVTGTFDVAADTVKLYINGNLDRTITGVTQNPSSNTETLNIGFSSAGEHWLGVIDEMRISDTVRSTDWIKAEYVNQNDAMNTYGSEQTPLDVNWSARRKITFDNSASATNLTDFPVRVSLSSANIDYAKTQNSGQDIRFADSNGTPLKYEIEKWNEAGTSEVWVKVPQVDSGSSTDYIWMYYGNASASDGQDVNNVWNSNYKGVWHLKETPTATVGDSTASPANGTTTGMSSGDQVAGQIDGALSFTGGKYVNMGSGSKLDPGGTSILTMETWLKRSTSSSGGYIQTRGTPGTDGYEFSLGVPPCTTNQIKASKYAVADICVGSVPADTSWHHVAVVWSGSGVTAYIDGTASSPTSANTTSFVTAATGNFYLGTDSGTAGGFDGLLDEVRSSNTARSADWIKASYKTAALTFNTFGSEEPIGTGGAVFGFYDNATPADGATLSSNLLTGSDVSETYQESMTTPVNPNAVSVGQQAEWDFSLNPANAVDGTTYYFRMVKSDGTALSTYTYYPQLTISLLTGPTLDQQMRGGQSVVNGTKAPFSF